MAIPAAIPPKGPNMAKILWPLMAAGLVYGVAAARSQKGFAPLASAGIVAFMVKKSMDNQKDYIGIHMLGSKDLIPF